MSSEVAEKRSSRILDEIAKRKSKKTIIDVEEERIKLVIFTLKHLHFAFYGSDVREILPVSKINFVPGAPEFINGIINVRGDIESVIDLNLLMGLQPIVKSKHNRIIIVEKNNLRSGILVGAVEDVKDVIKSGINKTIPTLDPGVRDIVVGEINSDGHSINLIDVAQLFQKKLKV